MLLQSSVEGSARTSRTPLDEPAARPISACAICVVRARAVCGALGEEALVELNRIGRKVRLKRGQVLIWQGGEANMVGNVIDGVLKMSAMMHDGREQIVGLAFPADFIGRPFGKNSGYTITALSDAELCVFGRAAFDSFAGSHAELGQALLRRALDDLDAARRWIMLLARKPARERVASLLAETAERLDGTRGRPFALPFSRQQMADILGLAIETVSRNITRLRHARVIDLPGGRDIAIADIAALHRIAGD